MSQHRVLIADHEPVVADLINSMLKQDGYETIVVYSSSDAVERGAILRPDLVIIDPIMPGLSGVEAATQVAKTTRSKILFLTTFAADRDFKDLVRGMRQQGFDCGALPKPCTKEQLLNYVRHEIGPVIVLTDAPEIGDEHSDPPGVASHSPTPIAAAAAPAPTREPLGDYEPLFAICNLRVYDTNAFRITGLDVDASLRDLARESEKLEMVNKLGVTHVHDRIFPLRTAPDTAALKSAIQKLKDPEQRLLHEFFWFWTVAPSSKEDNALKALREHAYERAVSLWKQAEKQDGTGVVTHNLAVYYHLAALEDELATASASGIGTPKNEVSWQSSYKYWAKLLNHHAYWDQVVARIKEIADPRLTIRSAERIWFSLPPALLSINARLAVAAAEKADFEEAARQRRLMFGSAFSQQQSIEALRRAFEPIRDELNRLCSSAEVEARANARTASSVVRTLFNDKKRLLQAFNYLLGADDQMRNAVFDLVAQTGRSCLIVYANETEDWATAQMLFEECLALAEGKSLRARLEEDIEVIAGNLAGQRARQSQEAAAAASQDPGASPRPTPSATPRSVPSSKPSNKSAWTVLAVIGFLAIVGMIKGCEDDTTSRTAAPSSSYTVQPKSEDAPPTSPTPSKASSSEIKQLSSQIEANRSQLKTREADLQTSQEALDGYKLQIDTDKARLRQIERDNDLGLAVDKSDYEMIRLRHNNSVAMYNDGMAEYNRKLTEYQELLRVTNEQIERYNALIGSR